MSVCIISALLQASKECESTVLSQTVSCLAWLFVVKPATKSANQLEESQSDLELQGDTIKHPVLHHKLLTLSVSLPQAVLIIQQLQKAEGIPGRRRREADQDLRGHLRLPRQGLRFWLLFQSCLIVYLVLLRPTSPVPSTRRNSVLSELAWLAGQWARAVIRGRVSSPNRTETVELGNRFWCVVKCSSCTVPQVFTTSAGYFRAIGTLAGSDTVSHAFASETEARIYLEAAGFEFPGFSMLLALPSGAFAEETLAAGLTADVGDLVGLSHYVSVEAGVKLDFQDKSLPEASEGVFVDVLLVDVAISMRDHLKPYHPVTHPLELLQTFNLDDPNLFPMPDALARATWDWIEGPAAGELVTYYSAEEGDTVPQTPPSAPKRRPRRPAQHPNGEGGGPEESGAQAQQKKPRPTVATLAANLEEISTVLPQIMQQMQQLNARTEAMEVKFNEEGPRLSALRMPLASSTMTGLSTGSMTKPAELAREFPALKGSHQPGLHPTGPRPLAAQEVKQLEEDRGQSQENSTLAQAVLAQSQALTSLVQRLTSGDPISDLSSSSSSLSSKGAMGRAKLQQELAQHKGTFYTSVLQSMSRRMQPALPSDLTPAELALRGVVPSLYVERYGGFGRSRDLGCLMWQVALIMDHMQNDNHLAAKDGVALLAVCLEQAALDAGRLDIGLLLALAEDPPSGVFQNRAGTTYARGRAFAPLAEQKWVTTALAFIKEMDLIASKRQDVTGKKNEPATTPAAPASKKEAKKPKGGGKKKTQQDLEEETFFSSLLARSFYIQCKGQSPASAVFPLPLLDFGLFKRSGPKLPVKKWRTLVRKRTLHILIVALNFLEGGFGWRQLPLLGRRPNTVQRRILHRLWALVAACDPPGLAEIPLVPGRSGPEFIARLRQLEHFAKSSDLFEVKEYGGGPEDLERRHLGKTEPDPDPPPGEQPYTSLNASRLKLVGRANWKLADFLDDELWLPFQEPRVLWHHQEIDYSQGPNLAREDRHECLLLAQKWGQLGLLTLCLDLGHVLCLRTCFGSLLQGDHLGVEFALSAHQSLLESGGLLDPVEQIKGHTPFPLGPDYQGLVIDDFFGISVCPASSDPMSSKAVHNLHTATEVYDAEGVLGSPEKDVIGSRHFKVVGAEVDASPRTQSLGLTSVAAPLQKRVALSVLTLRAARLPVISVGLATRLAGNWTSVFMYRRCLCSVINDLYKLASDKGGDAHDVFNLPRSTAQELVLAAVFSFAAATNVSAKYLERVFATDASMRKGALVSRKISQDIAKVLWLGGDKKGGYSSLDPPRRELARAVGVADDFDDEQPAEDTAEASIFEKPRHGLEFAFDFVEVCGGSGVVSKSLAKLGFTPMCPIEISDSPHFDVRDVRLIEWLCHLLRSGKLLSIMCEPVCTTFSPAAHPAVRSYSQPLGFDRKNAKTLQGNIIAFRCLFLLWYADLCGRPALGEQPRLSKMAWLSIWQFLLKCRGFCEAVVASCQFGSIHKKEFRLIGKRIDMQAMQRKCCGGHLHVRIEGKYTKPSSMYTPGLADHFANAFATALRVLRHAAADEPRVSGVESVVANDLLSSGAWQLESAWFWRAPSHINILESHAYLAVLKKLAVEQGDVRFTTLLDSRVAKCSHAKGRSSSKALRPTLQKGAAWQIAGGLYPALGFSPTRLNTADAPSRDRELEETPGFCLSQHLSLRHLQKLHATSLSRPAAGWVRLALLALLCMPVQTGACVDFAAFSPALSGVELPWTCLWTCCWTFFLSSLLVLSAMAGVSVLRWVCCLPRTLQIPSTVILGLCIASVVSGLPSLDFPTWVWPALDVIPTTFGWVSNPLMRGNPQTYHVMRVMPLVVCIASVEAMPILPQGTEDQRRAQRRAQVQLATDRVIRPQTRSRRDALLEEFDAWLAANAQTTLSALIEERECDPEYVSEMLVAYGKELFYAGKAYGRFSETINGVAARRPMLKRQLAGAWNLAFSWVSDEPHTHHPAMPLVILLAFSGLALLWGWPREAALLLMAWSGLLRIGEVFAARRKDLVLPGDGVPGVLFALLQIHQPKTRGVAARHQAARIDPADVVQLLIGVFGRLNEDSFLWNRMAGMSLLHVVLCLLVGALQEIICPRKADSFKTICQAASVVPNFFAAEVPVQRFNEKENDEVRIKFNLTLEDFPALYLFQDTAGRVRYTDAVQTPNMIRWLRSKGIMMPSITSIDELDALVDLFLRDADPRHVEQAREIAKKYSTDPKAPMKLSSAQQPQGEMELVELEKTGVCSDWLLCFFVKHAPVCKLLQLVYGLKWMVANGALVGKDFSRKVLCVRLNDAESCWL
eukprot:s6_g12.t1